LINIHLNGELREVPEGLNLVALLDWLKLPADRVAVERNLEIVPRSRWGETIIQANDRLEVVHFVGGGKLDLTVPFRGREQDQATRNAEGHLPRGDATRRVLQLPK
jgi:thiamine biosynthesis protein ThiS